MLDNYIRRRALEAVNEVLDAEREVLALRSEAAIAPATEYYLRKRFIPQPEKSLNIVDEMFDRPTEFTCYLDLRNLTSPDAARVSWFLGIRGDDKNDLVQVASRTYSSPEETMEAVVIGPQVVLGRVVVTYRLVAGDDMPAPVFVQAFGVPVFRSKVDA